MINLVYEWITPDGPLPNNYTPLMFSHDKRYYSTTPHLYRLYAHYNQATVYSVNDTARLDHYVYEMTYEWWMKSSEFFSSFGMPVGLMERYHMSPQIKSDVMNKKAVIAIVCPTESYLGAMELDDIHNYMSRIQYPSSQFMLLNGCPNGREVYEQHCAARGWEPTDIKFMLYPTNFLNWGNVAKHRSDITFEVKPRNKDFLILNRNWHPHRVLMMCELYKLDLLKTTYCSFNKTEIDNNLSLTHVLGDVARFRDNPLTTEEVAQLDNMLPLVLDKPLVYHDCYMHDSTGLRPFYDDSWISVISETNFYHTVIHMTEKSYKPILNKHAFIMFGPKGSLRELKKQGFKSFSDIWDESYDEIEEHNARFDRVLMLMKEISEWDTETKNEKMQQCADVIEHNYALLKEGPYEYMEMIHNKMIGGIND